MKPTLLILAAGMGSRYGGLKQVEPVGPNSETIIDYSIYDAIRAGFGKLVFVIRESFADAFINKFDPKLKGRIEYEYVFQELDKYINGFQVPEGRGKPWGTAHAVLVTKNIIKEPFCVINADDFYGYDAYKVMAEFLKSNSDPEQYSMVGYKLHNTLSEFGSVSRGICEVDENGQLKKIVETHKIHEKDGKIISEGSKGNDRYFTGNEIASMNIWGLNPAVYEIIEYKFLKFLENNINEPKSEIYIPTVVSEIINERQASVKVLKADSSWFGVTYKEDTPFVIEKIRSLIEKGVYPERLF